MTRYACFYKPLPPAPQEGGFWVGVWRAAKPPATPPFCPLLPRLRGRRGLGDERVITCRRGNLLCTLPTVPFATWQGWLNSYSQAAPLYISKTRV